VVTRKVVTYHVSTSNWYVIKLVIFKKFYYNVTLYRAPPREYDEVVRSNIMCRGKDPDFPGLFIQSTWQSVDIFWALLKIDKQTTLS
jgi:hypothetical protein